MSAPEFSSIEIAAKITASSPRHVAKRRKQTAAQIMVGALVVSGLSLIPQFANNAPQAVASVPADSIALYLSAPMVQGPTATGSNVFIETFDEGDTVTSNRMSCPTSSVVFRTIENSFVGNADDTSCGTYNPIPHPWGGASTTSSNPTFNLTASDTMTRYAQVHSNKSFTLTLDRSSRYVGFWWTSGGTGNGVSFYDENDVLIASFSSTEIDTKLNANGGNVVAVDSGITYLKSHFLGHPAGHISATPTITSARPAHLPAGGWDTGGQYAFLNLYVGGSIAVKKLVFSGGPSTAFEFDNLTISSDSQTPATSMVKVSEKVSLAPLSTPPSSSGGGSSFVPVLPATPVVANPCTASPTATVNRKSRAFSGFAINSAVLTPAMKRQIRNWIAQHPERACVSVAGFTMGPRVLPTDPKLARDRARSVRAFIKSIRPEASFTPITSRTQRLVGDDVRRAKVTLRF